MNYLVIFEKASDGTTWAEVPDLPGCFSSGATLDEAKKNVVEAIELHLEGLQEEGKIIPQPSAMAELISVKI